jgi:ABC-type transport system involved in multi-copper enzyme maturation permease subunit
MSRRFEIYQNADRQRLAVPCGFSFTAALLDWIWALWLHLWLEAGLLALFNVITTFLLYINRAEWPTYAVIQIAQGLAVGIGAHKLRALSAERHGYAYLCTLEATDGPNALAKLAAVGGTPLAEWRAKRGMTLPSLTPRALQPLLAVTQITISAAFRFRLVLVLLTLLMTAVVVLPVIIKHDGSAQGFTQILITYTLTAITALLGIATLWLACGSLAREVEDYSMQLVCTKPIPRWQIWLGKWLGLVVLNAALLSISGLTVYGLLRWKAAGLNAAQQQVLREEIFVARASAREVIPDIEPQVEQLFQERIREAAVANMDRDFVRKQIREQIKAVQQYLPPGTGRRWVVNLGRDAATRLKDVPLHLRVKFISPDYTSEGTTFPFGWEVGPPEGHRRQTLENSFAPDSFTTFPIEPNHIAADGTITIDGFNLAEKPVLFPLEDSFEVLYREGGFGLNFARGLGIIFCWLGLLAAIGLFAAAKLQFAVAAFVSMSILFVGLSSGTLGQVVEQGGIMGINSETGFVAQQTFINQVSVQIYGSLKQALDLVTGYNPVDALSTGRSITWSQLAAAFGLVVVVTGGTFAGLGMWIFTRRELAAPQ